MNYEDATKMAEGNQNLIGTIFKGDVISELIITPENFIKKCQVIQAIKGNRSYTRISEGEQEFTVTALLNFNGFPHYNFLRWSPLEEILTYLKS